MKGAMMTKAQLEAEVTRLRSEVALLKAQQSAHVCPQWPASPVCTCAALPGTVPCPVHFPPTGRMTIWSAQANAAGCNPMPQTLLVNTVAANPPTVVQMNPTVCAAAAAPLLTYWVNV